MAVRKPPCPKKCMNPSKYPAPRATTACGGKTGDARLRSQRAADESRVVQRVHHAAEESVHEHGVRAVVARGLRALDHHEHDGDAVRRMQRGRQPLGIAASQKRQQDEPVMTTGNTMRNSATTFRRTLLNCQSTKNATAVISDAPMESAFTNEPMAGVIYGQGAHEARAQSERPHAQRGSGPS